MSIFAEVLEFIRDPDPDCFEQLALDVFRFQVANVAPYRTYLAALGCDPLGVGAIEQIPPLSTLAFKYTQTECGAVPPGPASRLFRTSGTTTGVDQRGRHLVLDLAIYRAAALSHLRRMFFPDMQRMAILALHPTADRMPESSLGQMFTWAGEEFGTETVCTANPAGIDVAESINFLDRCRCDARPVAILATTAACARLFEAVAAGPGALRLPPGSRLMDTGGAKGQSTPLDATAVVELAAARFGLARALVINEYGMTELCSQLYDATPLNSTYDEPVASRRKLAPPWLRPFALDPATLRPIGDGEAGALAFFDLANVGSVSMLLTEDIGTVVDGAAQILGRAPTAEARGCALAITEFAGNNDTDSG
jgi:hypothetical protein